MDGVGDYRRRLVGDRGPVYLRGAGAGGRDAWLARDGPAALAPAPRIPAFPCARRLGPGYLHVCPRRGRPNGDAPLCCHAGERLLAPAQASPAPLPTADL